jgi:origin recognition complex subunit 1
LLFGYVHETGKTACFKAAIRSLQEELRSLHNARAKRSDISAAAMSQPLDDFDFVEINCLKLHAPHDAYSLLWKGLSGERVSPKTALTKLSAHFSSSKKNLNGRGVTTVCLLDELDFLVSGNEAVVYNFFDWPQLQESSLIVVGIANTMDLPERLSPRVRSRLGGDHAHRMVFQPYSHDQVRHSRLIALEYLICFRVLFR